MAWLKGWAKRVKLTADSGIIDADLTDFPALLYISGSSGKNTKDLTFIFDEIGANSKKIAVTKSDGMTECYVEIERWDSANEKAWLWVKHPTLDGDADEDYYLYFDNTHYDNTTYVGDPSSAPAMSVWDSNFKVRYSMKDLTASTIEDSTSNNLDGTKKAANEPVEADGKIGRAQDFDGTDDYIGAGDVSTFAWMHKANEKFTLELWMAADQPTKTYQTLFDTNSGGSGNVGVNFWLNNRKLRVFITYGVAGQYIIDVTSASGLYPNDTNPHHVVWNWDHSLGSNNARVYIDGDEVWVASKTANTPSSGNSTYAFRMGSFAAGTNLFDGKLDEYRVSNNVRTAAWIKTSYNSGNDTLWTWGDMETSPAITVTINGVERTRATRLDIFRESLGGVGRFEIALDNKNNIYGGVFSPQDAVELEINGTSMMKGYVDNALPKVDDPAAVYHNLIKVTGRDYGQDLVNLFRTGKYLDQKVDDIFEDALGEDIEVPFPCTFPIVFREGSEITYTSPHDLAQLPYEFKRQYLLDGFCELAKLVDADFYVDDDKALQLFLLSMASSSGVTLKSVPGDATNNILSLDQIGEKVGFDIRNYIHIEAGDVDDHWTEGNAGDWTAMAGASGIIDETTATLFLSGKASIRATADASATSTIYIQFPKYNHDTLDFSVIGETDCSMLTRHDLGAGPKFVVYIRDDEGNELGFYTPYIPSEKWYKITFPMGIDVALGSGDNTWQQLAGSDFTWKITRIGLRIINYGAVADKHFWIDGLKLGDITATAISEDAVTSQPAYRKRMIPLTRSDIKSQLQLDALAVSELAKRKDPSQKLKVTAIFQPNCKFAGQTVVVNAPSSGINSVTYRILGLHHVAAPYEDLLRGFDAITEFDLVKYETTGVDPLRLRLINNPTWTEIQRLQAKVKALERG